MADGDRGRGNSRESPAFEDFAVDDEGRIWVAVNTRRALEEGYTEYWIFGPEGTLLRELSFDRIVFLKSFGEQYAYGMASNLDGPQQIVRAPIDTLFP